MKLRITKGVRGNISKHTNQDKTNNVGRSILARDATMHHHAFISDNSNCNTLKKI